MADQGYISDATYVKARKQGLGLSADSSTSRAPSSTLRLRPAGADRQVRGQQGARGRLKVYTTLDPACRRLQSARSPLTPSPGPRRRSSRPTSTPVRSRRWRRRSPTRTASSTSPPREAPAGVVVQALRADRGRRSGGRSGLDLLPGAVDDQHPAGPRRRAVDGLRRRRRLDQPPDATANSVNMVYAQLVTRHRPGHDGRDGEEDGRQSRCRVPGGRPRSERRHRPRPVERLRDDRQRGVHHDPTAVDKVVFPDGRVDEPTTPRATASSPTGSRTRSPT